MGCVAGQLDALGQEAGAVVVVLMSLGRITVSGGVVVFLRHGDALLEDKETVWSGLTGELLESLDEVLMGAIDVQMV